MSWLAGWLAGLAYGLAAGPQAWLDGPEGGTYVRMNGRTDGGMDRRKISPFYRTSSPIGAADLKPDDRSKGNFKGYKIRPTAISYFFGFRSSGLSKVCYCMVVVGFGTFLTFHLVGYSFEARWTFISCHTRSFIGSP